MPDNAALVQLLRAEFDYRTLPYDEYRRLWPDNETMLDRIQDWVAILSKED